MRGAPATAVSSIALAEVASYLKPPYFTGIDCRIGP